VKAFVGRWPAPSPIIRGENDDEAPKSIDPHCCKEAERVGSHGGRCGCAWVNKVLLHESSTNLIGGPTPSPGGMVWFRANHRSALGIAA